MLLALPSEEEGECLSNILSRIFYRTSNRKLYKTDIFNMKIGILQVTAAMAPTGGIRMQGLMWKEGLEQLGQSVELINFWNKNDWNSYDVIIVLGAGQMFKSIVPCLNAYKIKVVSAPIIDPLVGKRLFRFQVGGGSFKFLSYLLFRNKDFRGITGVDKVLVRSQFEKEYVSYSFHIPQEKISIVPLSFRIEPIKEMPIKENFCFHCSRLAAPGKNVHRLIEAAKKYSFKLVLSGHLHGKGQEDWLKAEIDDYKNIEYVGVLSDEELCEYYKRAKVFALPSLEEGVGMVALEAAAYGCEIVLTNLGAPKEYYQGRARLVNPKSVDEIGTAIVDSLKNGYSQPELKKYIEDHYSLKACSLELLKAIK